MGHHSPMTIEQNNDQTKEEEDQSVAQSKDDDNREGNSPITDACDKSDIPISDEVPSKIQDQEPLPDDLTEADKDPSSNSLAGTTQDELATTEELHHNHRRSADDHHSRSRSRSPSKSKNSSRSHSHHHLHRHKSSSNRHRSSHHSSRHDRHRHKSDKHRHHHHHHHRDKERGHDEHEEKQPDDRNIELDVVPDNHLSQDEIDLNGTTTRSERSFKNSSRHREDRDKDRDKDREKDRERDRHKHRSRRSRSRSRSRSKSSRHGHKSSGRRHSESPISKRNASTIFVMQLAARVTSRDLDEFFSSVGKVREVRLIMDTKTRRHKGIAYIEFQDASSIPLAFALNGQRICGVPILIQPTQAEKNRQETLDQVQQTTNLSAPNSKPPGMRIYVGSLHPDLTEDMLKGVFEPFGMVSKIELIRSQDTGKSKGYGFVTFYDPDDANKAIKQLNGFELAGKPIRVSKTTERSDRSQNHANGQDKINSTASIYSTSSNPIVNDFSSPTNDRI